MQFRILIQQVNSTDQFELFPKSWGFTEVLNEEMTAEFEFSYQELKQTADTYGTTVLNMLTQELTEIWIYRNGSIIFFGVLSNLDAEPNDEGDIDLKINAISYLGLFRKRIAGVPVREFTSTDAGTIAWTLIDESQNSDTYGDWGITQGTIQTSVDRDRTYKLDNIRDAIVRLSNNNLDDGFDFEIDFSKDFNVYYPTKGQTRSGIVFSWQNIESFSYNKPLALSLTNQVHVIGKGTQEEAQYETRTSGTSYRSPFGLLEEKLSERDVSVQQTLIDKGDQYLADHQSFNATIELSHFDDSSRIEYPDYNVGDTITVNLPELDLNNQAMRVISRSYTMDEESTGLIDLELEV